MTAGEWFLAIVLSYFAGSIPFGVLIAKFKGVNIRQKGSKNIGATNVVRVLGRKYDLYVSFLMYLKVHYLCFGLGILQEHMVSQLIQYQQIPCSFGYA